MSEIKDMLYSNASVESMFATKKAEIEKMLRDLEELKETMNGGFIMEQKFMPLVEDVNVTFENDEQVIGKWLVLDNALLGDTKRHLYFLPNGEFYWCFGWTKGKMIFDNGQSKFLNNYRVERRGEDLYMTIDYKTQDFPVTGETTPIVLRKLDDIHYSKDQITRKDDINKAFIPDDKVLGKWKAFCYFDPIEISKKDFIPKVNPPKGAWNYLADPYFQEIEFFEGGHLTAVYRDQVISGDERHLWTKGYWLRKWNHNACAYEIKQFEGREYLIIEWKSGDYRFGGEESSYYVMVRA